MDLIDANVVLRYVLDDHEELSARATEIIEGTPVELPFEVLCEVVYVLQKVYHTPRDKVCGTLKDLLDEGNVCVPSRAVAIRALDIYGTTSLDIVDAVLCARHEVEGRQVHTFDDRLRRRLQAGG